MLGVAFNPNTDDIRLAPTIEVIRRPFAERTVVRTTDPEAMGPARAVFQDLFYIADPYEVVCGTDALLLLIEWEQYRRLEWNSIRNEMAQPLLIDARNMLHSAEMRELEFDHISFGRPDHVAKFNGKVMQVPVPFNTSAAAPPGHAVSRRSAKPPSGIKLGLDKTVSSPNIWASAIGGPTGGDVCSVRLHV